MSAHCAASMGLSFGSRIFLLLSDNPKPILSNAHHVKNDRRVLLESMTHKAALDFRSHQGKFIYDCAPIALRTTALNLEWQA